MKYSRTVLVQSDLYRVFNAFFHLEASGGIVLMLMAALALIWANSPWQAAYGALWHHSLTLGPLSMSLHAWVNDGLMALFFFVVGLEIKRELRVGELSRPGEAALPILAALGGMLAPIGIYVLLNPPGSAGFSGWAVPAVTDIAFSLGVLALLGARAPVALKVFLTALAIADDLGAVVLIALFYAQSLDWASLLKIALLMLLCGVFHRPLGRFAPLYALVGVLLWYWMLQSGIHATVAGVLLAALIPLRHIDRLQARWHPWVSYLILPLFALANAGVTLGGAAELAEGLRSPASLGVILGLLLGKQLGVFGAAWLSIKLGWARMLPGATLPQLYAVSWLTGIGFTMSLFIAQLAFADAALLDQIKLAVFSASLLAALGGLLVLYWTLKRARAIES